MNRMACSAIAAVFAMAIHSDAEAAPTLGGPAVGLWARPGDGGRGFNIDLQGDTMIVTTFVYTQTGAPIWYLSSGHFDHGTGVFKSTYDSFSDGQCFGCPPDQPVVHAADAGQMTIQFHDNQHATLTTPAGPLEIQKFNYAFGTANDVLYGEWAFSLNVLGLYTGDWVVFAQPYTATDGTRYVAGFTDDSFRFTALGTWIDDDVGYIVLIKENNYYDAYQFAADDRRGIGVGWVYPTSGSPTGSGAPMWLSRILYKGELQSSNAAAGIGGLAAHDAAKHRFIAKSGAAAIPPNVSSAIEAMRREIESQ